MTAIAIYRRAVPVTEITKLRFRVVRARRVHWDSVFGFWSPVFLSRVFLVVIGRALTLRMSTTSATPQPICFWKFGPRAKQGMRPLLADEVRPCSIYGEAFACSQVARRWVYCL